MRQRGWNAQPDGRLISDGGCPMIGSRRVRSWSRRGRLDSSPSVYGCRGFEKMVNTSPSSTTLPPYITTTRSAISAMSPRSWVIMIVAAPDASFAAVSTSSTCAWIVTSSAVVGSSAMRSLGPLAIAIATIARCRMPPEYSCGYWS